MLTNDINNPWIGLKSYPEGKKIYGRDAEIEELSQKILYNTQTVIYGRSGIGKSSILKAGVFPILRKFGYFPVYIRFVHDEDQETYTAQIIAAVKTALTKLRVEDLGAPDESMLKIVEGYSDEVVPHYDDAAQEGLWEFFHRHRFYYKLNDEADPEQVVPVLIFDQFEEIFTLQKSAEKVEAFFRELASLINNICPKHLLYSTVEVEDTSQTPVSAGSLIKKGLVKTAHKRLDYIDETNLRFVMSLREDYLSHLERNITHIPSLKYNRYCLLPLCEDKAVDIIMKPVPGLVEKDVAKSIICKVTGADYDDFQIDDNPELEVDSAILSLYLSELFKKKSPETNCITSDMVENQGADIISDFYASTMKNVSVGTVHFLEKRLVTKEERRDSIYVDQAIRHGVTRKEINYLVNQRLLHEYTWREGRRIEFAHDVLCPIVHQRNIAYDDMQKSIEFKETMLQKRKEKATRLIMRACLFFLFLIPLSAVAIYDGWYDVKTSRYASYNYINSWISGYNELLEYEAMYLPYHFVFYQKGRWAKHPFAVEARDGYGNSTSDNSITSMDVYRIQGNKQYESDNQLSQAVRWEFVPDNTGEFCIRIMAYDENRRLLYCRNNTLNGDRSSYVYSYVDEVGQPFRSDDYKGFLYRIQMDDDGREIIMESFDLEGFPSMNADGAYKTMTGYFENGLVKRESSMFIDGSMVLNKEGNSGWEVIQRTPDAKNAKLVINFDQLNRPCRTRNNIMLHLFDYDEHNRLVKNTYWYIDSMEDDEDAYSVVDIEKVASMLEMGTLNLIPDVNDEGVHGYLMEYNDHGQITYQCAIDKDGNPCKESGNDFVELIRDYDDEGNMILEEKIDENGIKYLVYQAKYDKDEIIREIKYNVTEEDTLIVYSFEWDPQIYHFVEKDYYHFDDWYRYKEFDKERRCVLSALYTVKENLPYADSVGLHRIEYEYNNKGEGVLEVVERYYNVDGVPCGFKGAESYHKEIMLVDTCAHTEKIIRLTSQMIEAVGYDDSEEIQEKLYNGQMINYSDDDFKVKVAVSSIDQYGRKVRSYAHGAYYYTLRYIMSISRSHEGENIGYYAINEFDELSLISSDETSYAASVNDECYDENGSLITTEINKYPIVATIWASDELGFRLGDILVQQDEYTMWENSDGDLLYGLDPTPDYNLPHVFKVLRFNEDTAEYDIIEIRTEAGDERVLSIEYMRHDLTLREKERIKDVLRKNVYPHMFKLVPDENGNLYKQGLTREAFILSLNDWDMTTHFNGNTDSLKSVIQVNKGKILKMTLYDNETDIMRYFEVDNDTLGVHIDSYSINPPYYDKILSMYMDVKDTVQCR